MAVTEGHRISGQRIVPGVGGGGRVRRKSNNNNNIPPLLGALDASTSERSGDGRSLSKKYADESFSSKLSESYSTRDGGGGGGGGGGGSSSAVGGHSSSFGSKSLSTRGSMKKKKKNMFGRNKNSPSGGTKPPVDATRGNNENNRRQPHKLRHISKDGLTNSFSSVEPSHPDDTGMPTMIPPVFKTIQRDRLNEKNNQQIVHVDGGGDDDDDHGHDQSSSGEHISRTLGFRNRKGGGGGGGGIMKKGSNGSKNSNSQSDGGGKGGSNTNNNNNNKPSTLPGILRNGNPWYGTRRGTMDSASSSNSARSLARHRFGNNYRRGSDASNTSDHMTGLQVLRASLQSARQRSYNRYANNPYGGGGGGGSNRGSLGEDSSHGNDNSSRDGDKFDTTSTSDRDLGPLPPPPPRDMTSPAPRYVQYATHSERGFPNKFEQRGNTVPISSIPGVVPLSRVRSDYQMQSIRSMRNIQSNNNSHPNVGGGGGENDNNNPDLETSLTLRRSHNSASTCGSIDFSDSRRDATVIDVSARMGDSDNYDHQHGGGSGKTDDDTQLVAEVGGAKYLRANRRVWTMRIAVIITFIGK